jgi:hypothetical protein
MAEHHFMRAIWELAAANAAARSQALNFAAGPRTKRVIPALSATADSVANAGSIRRMPTAEHKDLS